MEICHYQLFFNIGEKPFIEFLVIMELWNARKQAFGSLQEVSAYFCIWFSFRLFILQKIKILYLLEKPNVHYIVEV